jgi:hypothetical protein
MVFTFRPEPYVFQLVDEDVQLSALPLHLHQALGEVRHPAVVAADASGRDDFQRPACRRGDITGILRRGSAAAEAQRIPLPAGQP